MRYWPAFMLAPASRPRLWLFGPLPDLLLGCGLLYAASVLLFSFSGGALRAQQPDWVFPALVLLVSLPHYGATLLRVYERAEDRRQHRQVALWATLAIVAATLVSLREHALGCAMVTLFVTWSPWHYAGQNFGIAMLFLGRGGVAVPPLARSALRASFFLSFVLVTLLIHQAGGRADSMVLQVGEPAIRFVPLGLPPELVQPLFACAFVLYALALGSAAVLLLRRHPLRSLLPAAALVGSQALWFSVPALVAGLGVRPGVEPLDWQLRTYYFMWIALAHAAQYLWITSYFARAQAGFAGLPAYFLKAGAAGTAIFLLPGALFAPGALGSLSYDGGLLMLVTAAGNLHHFVLDGAVWKLRSRRVRGVLLEGRAPQPDAATIGAAVRVPWSRLVWSAAGAALVLKAFAIWQMDVVVPSAIAARDYGRADVALDRLAWLGQDLGGRRLQLGQLLESEDPAAALAQYQRSLELRPTPGAFLGLGSVRQSEGDWRGALQAYRSGLEIAPEHPDLLHAAGVSYLRLGDPASARSFLERAARLRPDDALVQRNLASANRLAKQGGILY